MKEFQVLRCFCANVFLFLSNSLLGTYLFLYYIKETADDAEVTNCDGGCRFIASFGDWKSNRAKYSIVLEREQYFSGCNSLAETVLYFFAMHYALHLEYKSKAENTDLSKMCEFIQCSLFGISTAKLPRVKCLIRELARI